MHLKLEVQVLCDMGALWNEDTKKPLYVYSTLDEEVNSCGEVQSDTEGML